MSGGMSLPATAPAKIALRTRIIISNVVDTFFILSFVSLSLALFCCVDVLKGTGIYTGLDESEARSYNFYEVHMW